MNKFRYIFAPYKRGSKITCPSCGGYKRFRKYVDTETNIYLDERYGVCDSPGCHSYSPYEFPPDGTYKSEKVEIPVDDGTFSVLNRNVVAKSMKRTNNFSLFLKEHFNEDEVDEVCKKYCIGGSTAYGGNSTIFWQISQEREVHSGKIISYNPLSGKRIKPTEKKPSTMGWVHGFLRNKDKFKLQQRFFGEHLLNNFKSTKRIAIVESEKTAVIMSIVYENTLWLAAGSLYGLSDVKLNTLKGRKVTFFSDKGGDTEPKKNAHFLWKKRIEEYMKENGEEDWKVSEYLEKQENVKVGDDLADLVLQKLKK